MAKYLYLLPSKLLAFEPVDGADSHYLNLSHHPIINIYKKVLDFSLYNHKFYSSTSSTISLKFDYSDKILAFPEHSGISDYPLMIFFKSNSGTTPIIPIPTSSPPATMTYFTPYTYLYPVVWYTFLCSIHSR